MLKTASQSVRQLCYPVAGQEVIMRKCAKNYRVKIRFSGKAFSAEPYFFALKQENIAIETVHLEQKEKTIGFLFAHLDKKR